VIVDEVRELDSHDFIAAAKPTMNASPNPQILYLSNMGDDSTAVLNAPPARRRGPGLAYLEWSAAPERDAGDVEGLARGEPVDRPHAADARQPAAASTGRTGSPARWRSSRPSTSAAPSRRCATSSSRSAAGRRCEEPALEPTPRRASWGRDGSARPAGERGDGLAPADGTIGLRLMYDVTGSPIDTDALGKDLRDDRASAVVVTGFDPLTDAQLAKYFTGRSRSRPEARERLGAVRRARRGRQGPLGGRGAVGATSSGRRSASTTRRAASRPCGGRPPITALLAAIRAVWLASPAREPRAKRGPAVRRWASDGRRTLELYSPEWWLDRLLARSATRARVCDEYDRVLRGRPAARVRVARSSARSSAAVRPAARELHAARRRRRGRAPHRPGLPVREPRPTGDETWRIWQDNQLDAESQIAHEIALVKGVAYTLVAPPLQGSSSPAHHDRGSDRDDRRDGARQPPDPARRAEGLH
jgi:hypothetical protein